MIPRVYDCSNLQHYLTNNYLPSADKDIPLPLGYPVTGRDGRQIHEVVVPAGTVVLVNILGVNRDPNIWGQDASEWKPERWLSPLPASVSEAHIPSVFSNT